MVIFEKFKQLIKQWILTIKNCIVLIVADQKNIFYDDQVVKCPKDSKVMQVGRYNYQTQMGWKTVPIIRFVKVQ